ncbi:Gfo/Idh/MocA family protein [Aquibacillus kalidii]|uniref:Gfo/Idh/MocA family protein n=1 Tax=Aquibacillus kalidii TaxID=2762597 RepID=UPI0016489853|nr:Gfo/Idh/MocA family oxidoreductase [Aquibacillus kalidii]
MERKLKVAMIGLGNIAQKAYLPILSRENNWELVGVFTPNEAKSKAVSSAYRLNRLTSLRHASQSCDAAFVHSSTASHYEVVAYLLSHGVDVYVDKPLATNVEDSERLVHLSEKHGRKLMVGFNRRFAPMYKQAKEMASEFDSVQIEKHRPTAIGPQPFSIVMLDDYLHLIDTIRWLAADELQIIGSFTNINIEDQLIYARHSFQQKQQIFSTAMHRHAGTDLERLEIITEGSLIRVVNMNSLEVENKQKKGIETPGSWESILKTRGFEDCVQHFIDSVLNDTIPDVDGLEALKSQQLVEKLIINAKR